METIKECVCPLGHRTNEKKTDWIGKIVSIDNILWPAIDENKQKNNAINEMLKLITSMIEECC